MPDVSSYAYSFDKSHNGHHVAGSSSSFPCYSENPAPVEQEAINAIYKNLDDMFLRFFCIRSDKSEIERFKESGLTSIREIKKSLDSLGLKFKE
jgi:hypothetical protein